MIKIRELREKSLQWGILIETVDKDWVLGQLLNGMYQQRFFVDNLIFKGGTCIKKLYFHRMNLVPAAVGKSIKNAAGNKYAFYVKHT